MKKINPVSMKIEEKQNEMNEEKRLKKKNKSINKLVLSSSLILFVVTLISLIRIILNFVN